MATNAPSFLSPATIARAYGRVSLAVTREDGSTETLPPGPVGARRVLIVDADVEFGARVVRALRADGLDATSCAPTDDFLACVLSSKPDVILVHTRRGDQRALTVCRQLHEFDTARTRAVIAYAAGDAQEDAVVHALHSGADDYVADVGRYRELRARVSAQLRHLRDREVMRWARAQRSSLRDLANTDTLTGIANRRAVEKALDRALTSKEPMAFVLVDIDHFKRINDTFGHPAGDVVLRRVARALHGVTPFGGTAGRWGGEEFAIVWPGDGKETIEQIGERFRRAVGSIVVREIDGIPQVTASIGVAAWGGAGAAPSSSQLIAAADAALYQSKSKGRNRVNASIIKAA
jgi:diguanylate cyclase (GGDEF)-like protein